MYALVPGYVQFYNDIVAGKARKMIGVTPDRTASLPRNELALGRSRYFGGVDLNREFGKWELAADEDTVLSEEELQAMLQEAVSTQPTTAETTATPSTTPTSVA